MVCGPCAAAHLRKAQKGGKALNYFFCKGKAFACKEGLPLQGKRVLVPGQGYFLCEEKVLGTAQMLYSPVHILGFTPLAKAQN